MTLPVVKNMDGDVLRPRQMMLHEEDRHLLMLDQSQKNKIYAVDLEKGKVVNEWNAGPNTAGDLLRLAPEFKNA